jgi:hypothetical protein
MSASSSTPSPHRIAILMSPVGRFLQCRDCQLSFTFPDGAQFGPIAKQFGFYRCSSTIRIPAWRTDRHFVIVRYEGRVPAMASCGKCDRKSVKSRRDKVMASRVGKRQQLWMRL